MTEFSNKFLIAMPHLTDPNFAKSLVYIFEHNDKGALGVIVNKPLPSASVSDILIQTRMSLIKPRPDLFFGGPVGQNQGMFLHSKDYKTSGTSELTGDMRLTTNPLIIDDLIEGNGPLSYRCSFGYAGWGDHQLEREFENGDWLVMPATPQIIFEIPDNQKWEQAAKQFGIDILDITGHTGFA